MGALYDSGLEPDDPIIAVIKPGVTVAYRLLPKDIPTDPNKVWRGKVMWCDRDTIFVELLEPDFQNLREYITYQQIVGVS